MSWGLITNFFQLNRYRFTAAKINSGLLLWRNSVLHKWQELSLFWIIVFSSQSKWSEQKQPVLSFLCTPSVSVFIFSHQRRWWRYSILFASIPSSSVVSWLTWVWRPNSCCSSSCRAEHKWINKLINRSIEQSQESLWAVGGLVLLPTELPRESGRGRGRAGQRMRREGWTGGRVREDGGRHTGRLIGLSRPAPRTTLLPKPNLLCSPQFPPPGDHSAWFLIH